MSFQEALIERGYERYSLEYSENKGFEYTRKGGMYDFSTIVGGRLDNRWIKDGVEIVFGLSEKGLPPTLVSPVPLKNIVIRRKKGIKIRIPGAKDIIRCIDFYGIDKVIEAIENKEKLDVI